MTSDDQFFFDYVSGFSIPFHQHANSLPTLQLASIPHDVRRYSLEVADSIDRQFDHAAAIIRDTLSQQTWLPPSVRPSPRTYPSLGSSGPQSFTDRVQDWFLRNRAWSAAIIAFASTTSILYFGSKKLHGKRRKARRALSGARKEIVGMFGILTESMGPYLFTF